MPSTIDVGATNAIRTCLAVERGEPLVLVTDEPTRDVGDALERAAREAGADVTRIVLRRNGDTPLSKLPDGIEAAAHRARVSIWAAASVKGELPLRMEYRRLVKHARHAHMPGVSRLLMETGMAGDYRAIAALTTRVFEIAKRARRARVEGAGSKLDVEFHPDWRWLPDTGLLHEAGQWGNLPAGETYTAPFRLNGRIVTPLLGDWLSEKYGLQSPPIAFDVRDSYVDLDSIEGGTAEARRAFGEYLTTDKESARAGEFAIGTNVGLTRLVGNLLQDEKFPGVHVAFGHPYADETGAPWTATTHIDVILPGVSCWLDDRQILADGRFLV